MDECREHQTIVWCYSYSYGQSHKYEVGFIVNNILPFVRNFIIHSERICLLQLVYNWGNIAVINCHALIEDKVEQIKEEFYNQLDRVYGSIPYRTK
jgi:hypothetical protein